MVVLAINYKEVFGFKSSKIRRFLACINTKSAHSFLPERTLFNVFTNLNTLNLNQIEFLLKYYFGLLGYLGKSYLGHT